jgi:hypothetical protein
MVCLTGSKQKLEILSIALAVARVVDLQNEIWCAIVPSFFHFLPRAKSTVLGLMWEFLLVSESASKIFHTFHRLSSINSTMAFFSPQSVSTTSTIYTEEDDDSISEAGDGNGRRRATPFDKVKATEKGNNQDDSMILGDFILYNEGIAAKANCLHRAQCLRVKVKKCSCLHVLRNAPLYTEAVAQYQLFFGRLKRQEQQRIFVENIRSSLFHFNGHHLYHRRHAYLSFSIPFILSEDETATEGEFDSLRDAKICRDALMDILGLGKMFWETCVRHVRCNTVPEYKLAKGSETTSNRKHQWDELYFDSLVVHFEELRKEAGPIATRFVRERTGETTTRDNNEVAEYLAPDFSKRQCYYKYCQTRGARVTSNNKGSFIVEDIEGVPRLPIPSWTSYRSFWAKEYPNLRVSRPVEDICSSCYIFHHKFRYKQPRRGGETAAVDDNSEDDVDVLPAYIPPSVDILLCSSEDEEDNNDEQVVAEEQEEAQQDAMDVDGERSSDGNNEVVEEDVEEEVLEREKEILKATMHVKMARAQRLLVNEKMSKAKEDATANTIHSERTYTLIVDYGQNMALPWFGKSQPGDTYYFTPLNVFNLGCVDVSHPDGEHLYCHIYKEGDGKKGGNNVASLLIKSLRYLNILQEGSMGKELNVVFDNCPGQNKNHHVIWLVPYLVEMGYFRTVNFIFLVVGHTKNAADRRFNNLKMAYRKSNVYTFNQLLEVCGKSPHVTVVPVVDGDFKDYETFLGLFYGRLVGIKKGHVFSCKRPVDGGVYTQGTKLLVCVKESNLEEHPTKIVNIILPKMMLFDADGTEGTLQEAVDSRLVLLRRADFLDHLPFKGVPEFKQVQLYKSYRKFIPKEYQDEMCPKPSDEVLKRQKEDQKRRVYEKKEAKVKKVMESA